MPGNLGQVEVRRRVKCWTTLPNVGDWRSPASCVPWWVQPSEQAISSQQHCFTPRCTAKGQQKTSRMSSIMSVL